MSGEKRQTSLPEFFRACLVVLLIDLLVFPPAMRADAIVWGGGNGSWSNTGNWSCPTCAGPTFPNNTSTQTFDATINTGSDNVTLDVSSTINSLVLGGTGSMNPSTLTIASPNNLVLGTTTMVAPGTNVLTVGNGGTLNISGDMNGGSATLELSGGGTAFIDVAGQINVTDGGTFTLQNTNMHGSSSAITNNGAISVVGTSSAANLVLNDAGNGNTFALSGTGTLTLGGLGQITATAGSTLAVNNTLTNWSTGTGGTLTGGNYTVASGATLEFQSIGAGNSIQNLSGNASVTVAGTGLLTGGGATPTNSLAGLTNITDSSLNLSGVTGLTITPGGSSPTLTLAADTAGTPASLTLSGASNVTVNGGFTNQTTTDPSQNTSTLTIQGGSTFTTGAFLNQANNSGNEAQSTSVVNVLGGSHLNVDSLTTSTNSSFNASSTINITDSTLQVTHDVAQGATSTFSQGNDTLNLTNSTGTVLGNFSNNNSANVSAVNLNNSSLTVDGFFSQMQTTGFGTSQLNLTGGSTMTVDGTFTNSSLDSFGTPQSQVSLSGGSSITVKGDGNFMNVSGGILTGGDYYIGPGSSFNYTDSTGNITTIAANTILTLDGTGSLNNLHNPMGNQSAVANSLETVTGTLAILNGSSLTLSTLTNVDGMGNLSNGNFEVGNGSILAYGNTQDIVNLEGNLTLDGSGKLVSGIDPMGGDALSKSLIMVSSGGNLTLQAGANLTLTSASFTNASTVNVLGEVVGGVLRGSTLDLRGTTFTNVSGSDLTFANFEIGDASTLYYNGSDIATIDNGATLTLDGSGKLVSTSGSSDALSGSLKEVDGTLNLQSVFNSQTMTQDAATLNLTNPLLITGFVNTNGGGNQLSAPGLTNNGSLQVGQGDTADFRTGATSSSFTNLSNGVLTGVGAPFDVSNTFPYDISGTLRYDATSDTGGGAIIEIQNTGVALRGAGQILYGPGAGMDAIANSLNLIDSDGSTSGASLLLSNLNNPYGSTSSPLTLTPIGGALTVSTNDNVSDGNASLLLSSSTAIISGDLNNVSTTAFGGVPTSTIGLDFGSSLTVNNLNNTATDNGGGGSPGAGVILTNGSQLTVNGNFTSQAINNFPGSFPNGFTGINSVVELSLDGISSAFITGDLNNLATDNGGGALPTANVFLTNGSFLGVQNLNNTATDNGGDGFPLALVSLSSGSGLIAQGNVTNQAINNSPGFGTLAQAEIDLDNSGATIFGTLTNESTVPDLLDMSNNSLNAGASGGAAVISLDDSSTVLVETDLVNTVNNNGLFTQGGVANISLSGGSTLTVEGNVSNTVNNGDDMGLSGGAFGGSVSISLDASQLLVAGSLTNGAYNASDTSGGSAFLTLSNESTVTVGGLFLNDVGGTVTLSGGGNSLTGTGGLTNNGSLNVAAGDTADFRQGGAMSTGFDTFTNLSNGTLTGGSYDIGGTFNYDASMGTGGGAILAMQNASITLEGSGQILYGPGGGLDALASLSSLTDSNLTYNGAGTRTITPNGGTFSLVSPDSLGTSLNLNSGTNLTIDGNLTNGATGSWGTQVNLSGSSLTVDGNVTNSNSTFGNTISLNADGMAGSTLTATGTLFNGANGSVNLNGGGNQLFAAGFTNNGSIFVGAGDTADFRTATTPTGTGDTFTNLVNGTLIGGSYTVIGTFNYDASAGAGGGQILGMSGSQLELEGPGQILYGTGAGADALQNLASLTNNSSLTIDGQTRTFNPNGNGGAFTLSNSSLTLDSYTPSGSTMPALTALTIAGTLQNGGTINLNDKSTLTVQGLATNSSFISLNGGGNQLFAQGFTNSGSINVGAGDTADFRTAGTPTGTGDTFTNLVNGTLTGGSYTVAGTFNYDASAGTGGGQILSMSGSHIALEGPGQILYGPNAGSDALVNLGSLTNNSSLTLDGQTRTFNPGGTMGPFTISNSNLTLNSYTDNTNTTTDSSLTIEGALQNTGNVELFNKSTLTVEGLVTNNDFIALTGGGNTLVGSGFTNSLTIDVGAGDTADFRTGATPVGTGDTFTNLANGTLTGGSYNVYGTFDYDTSAGTGGGQILNMSGARIIVGGAGAILYGPNLNQADALVNLGSLANNSSLEVDGQTRTFNPGSGTFSLDSSSLTLNSYSNGVMTSPAVVTIAGALQTATVGAINIYGGSSLAVLGGVTIGSNTGIALNSAGETLTGTSLTNNGGLTVAANSTADFRSGTGTTLTNLSGNVLTGGTYDILGNLYYNAAPADGLIQKLSGANVTLGNANSILFGPSGMAGSNPFTQLGELSDSTLTIDGGSLTTTPGGGVFKLDPSTLNLNNGTVMTINGAVNNSTGSAINLNGGGNMLFAQGFTNNGSLFVGAGDTADFRGNTPGSFTNLSSAGVLTGGTYDIAGTFQFDASGAGGAAILNIAADTTVTLDSLGGSTIAILSGSGTDAIDSVNEVAGTLNIGGSGNLNADQVAMTRHLSPNGGTLTVDSTGAVNIAASGWSGVTTANITGSVAVNAGGQFNVGGASGSSSDGMGSSANLTGSFTNAGTVAINGEFNGITAGGTFVNSGTLNVNGEGDFVAAQGLSNHSGMTGGTINIADGATLDARVGGAMGTSTNTFADLQGTTLQGNGTFNVGGTFIFDPSSGTNGGNIYTIGTGATLALTSSGAQVLFGPGEQDALANLTDIKGTLNLENDASHTFTPNGGSPGGGTLTIDSTGAVNLSGSSAMTVSGHLTNAGAFTQQDNNSTTVNIGGNLNNSATGTYTVGYGNTTNVNLAVNNAAGGIINVNGGFDGSLAGRLSVTSGIDNFGAVNVNAEGGFSSAGGVITAGSLVTNEATGNITVGNDASITAPGFHNSGTLAVLSGGLADFRNGTFTNLSGGTLTGGTYNVGGTFQFDSSGGAINKIGAGTSLTLDGQNSGAYQVLSGTSNALANLTGNAGTFTLTNGVTFATDTTANGGRFTNTGTLTTNGTGSNAFNVTGDVFNTSPGVVNVNGAGDTITASGQFNNSGTVSFGGTNASITSTGDFTNAASGMVTVTGSGNTLTTDAMLDNSGDITVGGGGSVEAALGVTQSGGTLMINSGGGLTVQGGNTFTQTGGTTTVNIGGTLTAGLVDLQSGTLTGGGTIAANLTVDGGTLNPGDPQSIDVTGNYDQTAAGILDIDLAGTSSFDQVNVTGTAMLNGTLDLTLESGFSASVGTVFDIVNWTTPTMNPGNFTTFNDVTFNNGMETFMEAVNGNHVDITVESTTVAPPVPEPSTMSMVFASLLGAGILWRRRRRQTAAAK